jgi:integrase
MMCDLVHWDECAIELEWVVVEVGNKSVLRRLTKDGDDNAIIYVDQALMSVLKRQRERQEMWKEQLGPRWVDQGLVFARDGITPGGPQDAGQVSARWRSTRKRLDLPEKFRIHDWRHSKVTNDLDAGENPVEVSANVRDHSPGYTMAQYGKRRVQGARKLAAGTAQRIGPGAIA